MKLVLLVEDDDFVREYLARSIERRGFKVIGAAKGYEAIDLYKENKPDFVLLDIGLPDINGKEVLKQMREIDPNAKIYFVSGSEEIVSDYHAKQLGADGRLTKPIDTEEVMKIIGAVE